MKKLQSSLKNMLLVLTSICVIATAILAYVNQLTTGPIAQAKTVALKTAIAEVVPGFDNNPAAEVKTVTLTIEGKELTFKVYPASKENKSIGAAVESVTLGFGGDLRVLVGFDPEGNILNYSILETSETPGLGSRASMWFQKGAKGSIIGDSPKDTPFTVSKDGGQVEAITASTITSRAFLKAVNQAYMAYTDKETSQTTTQN
ncbi:MAG: RnfABCDGE type electron transport complex subunit G [Bacteroidaceae bacterium]